MTRHFFGSATRPNVIRHRPSRAKHKGQLVRVTLPNGQTRFMTKLKALAQLARQTGGRHTHAAGHGCPFTSASSKKALAIRWSTTNRRVRGHRIGLKSNRRPPVDHAALRAQYAAQPTAGLTCRLEPDGKGHPVTWILDEDGRIRPISEHAALIRLGHLPRRKGSQLIPSGPLIPVAPRPRQAGWHVETVGRATIRQNPP